MILNEDYFKDLEIEDEDIIDDAEEPKHELTVEELHKLPEQYRYYIQFPIYNYDNRLDIKTALLPKLFKRLDTIFEFYGIEHSEYVLMSDFIMKNCNTVVKLGDYQVFCEEYNKDKFINDTYNRFYVDVYVNYPKFTYKRAFHFLYTMLNLYRNTEQMFTLDIKPTIHNITKYKALEFTLDNDGIKMRLYYDVNMHIEKKMFRHKIPIYKAVMQHFFGYDVNIDYKALERDVPLKPIKKVYK